MSRVATGLTISAVPMTALRRTAMEAATSALQGRGLSVTGTGSGAGSCCCSGSGSGSRAGADASGSGGSMVSGSAAMAAIRASRPS